jgi:hypothetical protein
MFVDRHQELAFLNRLAQPTTSSTCSARVTLRASTGRQNRIAFTLGPQQRRRFHYFVLNAAQID